MKACFQIAERRLSYAKIVIVFDSYADVKHAFP